MDDKLLKKLPRAVKAVVAEAMRSGAVDRGELSMNEARRKVALKLALEEDALDAKDIRKVVRDAVTEAIDSYDEGEELEPESPIAQKSKSTSKGSSDNRAKTKTSPRNSTTKRKTKAEEPADTGDEDEDEGVEESPSSSSSMSSVYDEPPPKKGRAEKHAGSSADRTPSKQPSRKRKRRSTAASDPDEEVEPDDKVAPPSPASSAMSSVYDEPPKPKRTPTATKASKGKSKKDPNEGLSPDEGKLADLKRIVVACGVRKQWTKEFADCPTISEQIRHVQDILRDLGMKGNPTLGKAKSLRARRELAQELDDVKAYEEGHGLSADRPSRSRAARGRQEKTPPPVNEDGAMAAVMDFLGDDDSD